MNKSLLEGLNILDLSIRLPGPYSSYLLKNLGASIIKVEDHLFKDPFLGEGFSKIDQSFKDWYEELNKNKEIKRLDFKGPHIKEEISQLIDHSSIIISSLTPKIKELLGVTPSQLKELRKPLVYIELVASTEQNVQNLHDLNALALTGFLQLHLNNEERANPSAPFLPFGGIIFGQQIALHALAAYYKSTAEKKPVFLQLGLLEMVKESFYPFWSDQLRSKQSSFLHTGRYPCYSIYKTKDQNFVALAAVEEKFWKKFCEIFNLNNLDPFDQNPSGTRKTLTTLFEKLTLQEVELSIGNHEVCLSGILAPPK